jgi:chromosome segregation ATPase
LEDIMAIRELISKTGRWLSGRRNNIYEPLRKEPVPQETKVRGEIVTHRDDRTEALGMIQTSFEQLVEKLGGINENIGRQIKQNEELMQRIDELPQFLQNFPQGLKNQKAVIDALVEQLKVQSLKNQQFAEAVEKIPAATEKQTNAISDMAVHLSASADIDAQLVEDFRRFNSITDKLKDNIEGQTDSITQMSKTFLASDRYLKYILNTQHKRFMWVFIASLGVCVFAIMAMLIVIFLLK